MTLLDEVILQIHHLDDNEEADLVLQHIGSAVAAVRCRVERPTEASNSILVFCEADPEKHSRDRLSAMLENACRLVEALESSKVQAISDLGLAISLVVRSAAWQVQIPPDLARACGQKGIGIRIEDVEKFIRGVRTSGDA